VITEGGPKANIIPDLTETEWAHARTHARTHAPAARGSSASGGGRW
jgi:hypothetical protein